MAKVTSRRTQVYLTEEEYEFLRQEAGNKGSLAGVIRKLIDEKLTRVLRNYKNDPFYKWVHTPSRSGITDASRRHDDYIYNEERK